MSSAADRLIAKLDLVELRGKVAVPVETKKGATPKLGPWPNERVQVCAQALVLRANGWECTEGTLYYAESKQRVRVEITAELEAQTRKAAADLLDARDRRARPYPLVDSPKCNGCSIAGICLPDEINWLKGALEADSAVEAEPEDRVRRLTPPRDEGIPLHVTVRGAMLRKDGEELRVTAKDETLERARIPGTSSVSLYGNVTLTTPVMRTLLSEGIPVGLFSMGGWFYGQILGPVPHGVASRRAQYRVSEDMAARLLVAKRFVSAKIKNQRTLLRRNARELPESALDGMNVALRGLDGAESLDEVMGREGQAAGVYFSNFSKMLAPKGGTEAVFDFQSRNRRPPEDPVNAMLGFGYALLTRECTSALQMVWASIRWWGFSTRCAPADQRWRSTSWRSFAPCWWIPRCSPW